MGGLGSLAQMGFGIADRVKGKRLEQQAGDRPEYDIPESVDKMIGMYGQMANAGLPGQDLMAQDIQASTARTVGRAGQLADSSVGALGALGAAQEQELGSMRDLQTRAAQYQAQARQNYANAVGQRAQYEDQEWRQNELLPWETTMNRAMGLQSGGAGNIMGAADNLGAMGASAGSYMAGQGMMNAMYPNYGGGQVAGTGYGAGANALGTAGAGYGGYTPTWQEIQQQNMYAPK